MIGGFKLQWNLEYSKHKGSAPRARWPRPESGGHWLKRCRDVRFDTLTHCARLMCKSVFCNFGQLNHSTIILCLSEDPTSLIILFEIGPRTNSPGGGPNLEVEYNQHLETTHKDAGPFLSGGATWLALLIYRNRRSSA